MQAMFSNIPVRTLAEDYSILWLNRYQRRYYHEAIVIHKRGEAVQQWFWPCLSVRWYNDLNSQELALDYPWLFNCKPDQR